MPTRAGQVSLVGLLVALVASSPRARSQESAPYEEQIAPLLARRCGGCHNAEDRDGGLDLSSFRGLEQGGNSGRQLLVPGKSAESRLLLVIEGKARPRMPPRGHEPPTAAEVEALRVWIDRGAPGPTAPRGPRFLETPRIALTAPARQPIHALAFDATGKVVVAARDRQVELIDVRTRRALRRLEGFPGPVNGLAPVQGRNEIAVATGEPGVYGELQLVPLGAPGAEASPIRILRAHRDTLYAAVVGKDGRLAATAGYDYEINLWSLADRAITRSIHGHQGAVFDLALRPDGKVLASASADRTVKLWSTATGERLETFSQPLKDQLAVAFNPAGDQLAAGGADNRIRVWKISPTAAEGSNPLLHSRFAHEGAILRLIYSPDGRFLASAAEDGAVKIWDAAALVERSLLEPQPDWPGALAFSPGSDLLAVGRLDGSLEIYDSARGTPVRLARGPSLLGAAIGIAAALVDAPARPEIVGVTPRGIQRGAKTRLRVSGKALGPGLTAHFGSQGVVARPCETSPDQKELVLELEAEASTPPGPLDFWVTTPGGESAHLQLQVDTLPQVLEVEPNDDLSASRGVPPSSLPAAFWGTLNRPGDQDHFVFRGEAGQLLVLDVAAARIGSKANPLLSLFDETGRLLGSNNDFEGSRDPLLAVQLPGDGVYVAKVSDLELGASPQHDYRLAIGALPLVTGCFPLGLPAGTGGEVELVGWNLPRDARVKVPGGPAGEVVLPLDPERFRARNALRVVLAMDSEGVEQEPNDTPESAGKLGVPGAVSGRLGRSEAAGGDGDLFRFEARRGQPISLETEAARRGSPCDTKIEVLDTRGTPVPLVVLQAVRDSYLSFRGVGSSQTGDFRLKNWEEMELNELLYLDGEVVKLFRAPQGPDSGFVVYGRSGARRNYFGTSATSHPLDAVAYIVEAFPPGVRLIPNGLPVFPLAVANDDDSDRALGTDSRLIFDPPGDGTFLVRVTDSRGRSGPRQIYRLVARPAQPGLTAAFQPMDLNVAQGSGRAFTVTASRRDGFEGRIEVTLTGFPPGFLVSNPVVIEAGHDEAQGTIFALPEARQPTEAEVAALKITASARIGATEVVVPVPGPSRLKLEARPRVVVHLEPAPGARELVVAPGALAPAVLRVERNGHEDLLTFQVEGLPHGVIVEDIGLNGVLIRQGENSRQIFLAAARWVEETDRFCHAVEQQVGNQTSRPVLLKVRKQPPAP